MPSGYCDVCLVATDTEEGLRCPGQFVHIPQNRKATLLDCAKECWLNLACQAFSYDQEVR